MQQSITKGKALGHWVRRLIHISMFLLPLLYYAYGLAYAEWLWLILVLIITAEIIRLSFGITVFGQRSYEKRQISALAWGIVALILVLLFAPSRGFAIPIIWTCAFADPLLGELRARLTNNKLVIAIGLIFVFILWLICSFWLNIAWWWAIIMAPVSIVAEAYRIRWIDDNATMMLVPLLLVLVVNGIID